MKSSTLRFGAGALVALAIGLPVAASAAPTRSAPRAAHMLHAKLAAAAPTADVEGRVPAFGGQTLSVADVRLFDVTSDKTGTAIDFIAPRGHYAVFAPREEGIAPMLGRAHADGDGAGVSASDAALVRAAPVAMQRALGYDVAALRPLDKSEARALAAAIESYVTANRANTSGVPLYRWVWPDTEHEYHKFAASLATFARDAG